MSNLSKKKRFLIGRLLMIFGLLIVIYPLTSISLNDLNKRDEYNSYVQREENLDKKKSEKLEKKIKSYNKSVKDLDAGAVDPFTGNDFTAKYNVEGEEDTPFSYILIPKIDVVLPVYLGASYKHLSMGAAHVDGTSLPVGGKGLRSVIAGHRGFYKDIMFLNLHKLENGDSVILRRGKKLLIYKVYDSEVIEPYDWDKLEPIDGEDVLTLLTCDPITPPSPYRLIVNAKRYVPPKKEKIEKTVEKIEKTEVATDTKNVNYLIYVLTAIVWALLIFVVYRSIVKYKKFKE